MPRYKEEEELEGRRAFVPSGERDVFDAVRGAIWGTPGFERRASTIVSVMPVTGQTSTYVVESIRTHEGFLLFIQMMDARGGQRFVLPSRVTSAIARQMASIVAKAKSERAKAGARTREMKGIVPFKKREEAK